MARRQRRFSPLVLLQINNAINHFNKLMSMSLATTMPFTMQINLVAIFTGYRVLVFTSGLLGAPRCCCRGLSSLHSFYARRTLASAPSRAWTRPRATTGRSIGVCGSWRSARGGFPKRGAARRKKKRFLLRAPFQKKPWSLSRARRPGRVSSSGPCARRRRGNKGPAPTPD